MSHMKPCKDSVAKVPEWRTLASPRAQVDQKGTGGRAVCVCRLEWSHRKRHSLTQRLAELLLKFVVLPGCEAAIQHPRLPLRKHGLETLSLHDQRSGELNKAADSLPDICSFFCIALVSSELHLSMDLWAVRTWNKSCPSSLLLLRSIPPSPTLCLRRLQMVSALVLLISRSIACYSAVTGCWRVCWHHLRTVFRHCQSYEDLLTRPHKPSSLLVCAAAHAALLDAESQHEGRERAFDSRTNKSSRLQSPPKP